MSDIYDLGGVIVNAETGEIIESDGDPSERIIAAGLEAKQQVDQWKAYHGAMKAAAASMLTEERKRIETVQGIAKRISYKKRTAKPDRIPQLLAELELTEAQVAALYECARDLDPALLDRLAEDHVVPGDVVDALITISDVDYVQFDAIRKMAPVAKEAE